MLLDTLKLSSSGSRLGSSVGGRDFASTVLSLEPADEDVGVFDFGGVSRTLGFFSELGNFFFSAGSILFGLFSFESVLSGLSLGLDFGVVSAR